MDYTQLTGTGPGGRITIGDIEAAAEAASKPVDCAPLFTEVPYSGMRKSVGENMALSWATAPRVTLHCRANVQSLFALRAELNEGADKARVSITDMLVALAARALARHPKVNAAMVGDGIRRYGSVNMGVAVALEDGLMVPVVKDADTKSLGEISAQLKELAAKAKNKGLTPEDMQGGTFTISNLGAFKSVEFFSPIINQPESAILGVGKAVDTPIAVDGHVDIAPLMGLSLTFDHRVMDGADAAAFFETLLQHIEQPVKTLVL